MFGGLEDVLRASSAPRDSKRQVAWHDYAIFAADFISALTTPSAKTRTRSSSLLSMWPETDCHLSNLLYVNHNSHQLLSNSKILRHVSWFYDTPLQFVAVHSKSALELDYDV